MAHPSIRSIEAESEAFKVIANVLLTLDDDARERVMDHAAWYFGLGRRH